MCDAGAVVQVKVLASLEIDRTVPEVTAFKPGAAAGMAVLESFCADRIKYFADQRNDPNLDVASNTSPYTHFGQISSQRAALFVRKHGKSHSAGTLTFSVVSALSPPPQHTHTASTSILHTI